MMRNLINRHDFIDAGNRLLFKRLRQLLGGSQRRERIAGHWNDIERLDTSNALRARMDQLITGSGTVSRYRYTADRYLCQGNLSALSVGCGDGTHEIEWARQGVFARIDGIDIAGDRVRTAAEKARTAGVEDICHFAIAELGELEQSHAASYDVVIFESSLHHMVPVRDALRAAHRVLRPGGYLLMLDFVGPSRWQWLPHQLRIVNAMIDMLPERYRQLRDGEKLQRRFRPSLLRMYLMDPSEAAESAEILPALRELFRELEFKNAGGSLLNHFLPKIQHNFDVQRAEDVAWLQALMTLEDLYLHDVDNVGYWYGYGVYEKPGGASQGTESPETGANGANLIEGKAGV